MIENKYDLIKEWYRFANMDLDSAKHLCSLYPKPLEIICYHSQQSVEKLLKGFLISNDIEAPKTHDLTLIRYMCEEIDEIFKDEKIYDICVSLSKFGVQPRYPNEIEILETDAEKALKNAQTTFEFFIDKGLLTINTEA